MKFSVNFMVWNQKIRLYAKLLFENWNILIENNYQGRLRIVLK